MACGIAWFMRLSNSGAKNRTCQSNLAYSLEARRNFREIEDLVEYLGKKNNAGDRFSLDRPYELNDISNLFRPQDE